MEPKLEPQNPRVLSVSVQNNVVNFDREILHLNSHVVHYVQEFIVDFFQLVKEESHHQNTGNVKRHDQDTDLLFVNEIATNWHFHEVLSAPNHHHEV